jgi:1-acyl-sn-glycerol-3-phosphate acyltransferase
MQRILAPFALLAILLHVLWGVLVAVLVFPLLSRRARDGLVRAWSRILLRMAGVRLRCIGHEAGAASPDEIARQPTGSLLLVNHVSWLDPFVLAAVLPVRFVAKSEVRHWPLFGRIAVAVGTLFVERGRRHAVASVNRLLAHRLQSGQSIAIFPEGTTTAGDQVLRFHANLVQPALDVGAEVRPVGLRFAQDGRLARAVAYAGDTTMLQSIWGTLVTARLTAEVHWLAPVAAAGLHRQEVGAQARSAIVAALGLPEHEAPAFRPEAAELAA